MLQNSVPTAYGYKISKKINFYLYLYIIHPFSYLFMYYHFPLCNALLSDIINMHRLN